MSVKLPRRKLTMKAGSMVPTAGGLSGGALSGGKLHKFIRSHNINKDFADKLHGAGIFQRLADLINNFGKKMLKKGVDKVKSHPVVTEKIEQLKKLRQPLEELVTIKGGKVRKAKQSVYESDSGYSSSDDEKPMAKANKLKAKREPSKAFQHRAQMMGKYMKNGQSMKEASEAYQKKYGSIAGKK